MINICFCSLIPKYKRQPSYSKECVCVCEKLVLFLNMESDKQHFRHILLFYYRKGKNAVQTRKKLSEIR